MRPNMDGVPFKSISNEYNVMLIKQFEEGEIKEAVWECEGSKCPGRDGFNFTFIKRFWEVTKEDVMRMLKDFYSNGKWPRGANSTFVTLVPKVDNPQGLEGFRPISLVGSLYKIVAKVLSWRLKKVLKKVIDISQCAFIRGRNMLDGIVTTNEVIDDIRRRK